MSSDTRCLGARPLDGFEGFHQPLHTSPLHASRQQANNFYCLSIRDAEISLAIKSVAAPIFAYTSMILVHPFLETIALSAMQVIKTQKLKAKRNAEHETFMKSIAPSSTPKPKPNPNPNPTQYSGSAQFNLVDDDDLYGPIVQTVQLSKSAQFNLVDDVDLYGT